MNFAVLTYFEVKLAYATAADNVYKELLLFRSMVESLGEQFSNWKSTITPSMTEGQAFVVVLHSEGTSLGTMAMIQSIKLAMTSCVSTGKGMLCVFVEGCLPMLVGLMQFQCCAIVCRQIQL